MGINNMFMDNLLYSCDGSSDVWWLINPLDIYTNVDRQVNIYAKSICMSLSTPELISCTNYSKMKISALAIISVIVVLSSTCSNTRLVSLEQRLFLRSRGDINYTDYIDYDSLPLLRRLFCWGILSALFAAMAVVTQVLTYLWLVENAVGMWNALLPVFTMFFLLLCYMWSISTISLGTCGIVTALVIDGILFCMKVSGEISISWWTISIPMMIVQIIWSGHLISIVTLDFRGIYELSINQRVSLTLYLASFLLCLAAELLTCFIGRNSDFIPVFLWTFAVPIFMIGSVIIMREEGNLMASSRGYIDPQSLSRTDEGWGSSFGSTTVSLLLGTIFVSRTIHPHNFEAHDDHDKVIEGFEGIDVETTRAIDRGMSRGSVLTTGMINTVLDDGRKASGQFNEIL